MLLLSRAEVESLLDIDALVDALVAAMADLSAGRASMPPRGAAMVESKHAFLAAMPAYLPTAGALTTKLVSLFPENTERPTHQALICCFDAENGTPIAIMDGTLITAARTAAGSALATKLLARKDAKTLTVVGTGVQARSHALTLSWHLKLTDLTIAGRDASKVEALASELSQELGFEVRAAANIEEAAGTADILCLATHAAKPAVRRGWLKPGVHINSVGYNTAGDGEVDSATIRDALIVVESRDAVLAPPPAGAVEFRLAIEQGLISPDAVRLELGHLVEGTAQGRRDDEQITLYKSVGVAVQDAAAASMVLTLARALGVGTEVEL